MFDRIRNIITDNETTTQIIEDRELKTRIAACVLFLEAAHIDNECTDEEMEHLLESVKTGFNLGDQETAELMDLSRSQREDAIDLWQFTNHMNRNYSKDEKLEVLETVWEIIHTDGRLDSHEDHFVHKLANLLRLNHKELIDAKIRARKTMNS